MTELTARFDLPFGVAAPRAARAAVQTILWRWGFRDRDWLAQVMVVVSELVTNAVRHGGGPLKLDVQAHRQRVTIGAVDGSAAVPRRRHAAGPDGGYGMALIEVLAIRWGVDTDEGGKRVWVDLPAPSSPRADPAHDTPQRQAGSAARRD